MRNLGAFEEPVGAATPWLGTPRPAKTQERDSFTGLRRLAGLMGQTRCQAHPRDHQRHWRDHRLSPLRHPRHPPGPHPHRPLSHHPYRHLSRHPWRRPSPHPWRRPSPHPWRRLSRHPWRRLSRHPWRHPNSPSPLQAHPSHHPGLLDSRPIRPGHLVDPDQEVADLQSPTQSPRGPPWGSWASTGELQLLGLPYPPASHVAKWHQPCQPLT